MKRLLWLLLLPLIFTGCACIGTIDNGTNYDHVVALKAMKSPKDEAGK